MIGIREINSGCMYTDTRVDWVKMIGLRDLMREIREACACLLLPQTCGWWLCAVEN